MVLCGFTESCEKLVRIHASAKKLRHNGKLFCCPLAYLQQEARYACFPVATSTLSSKFTAIQKRCPKLRRHRQDEKSEMSMSGRKSILEPNSICFPPKSLKMPSAAIPSTTNAPGTSPM
eukprot:1858623-Amphidinium_carterae.1